MKAPTETKNNSKTADGNGNELLRLRNRLLKQILDNQQRRELLRRDAATPTPLRAPSLPTTPPVPSPTQETG